MNAQINRFVISLICVVLLGLVTVPGFKAQGDKQEFKGKLPVGWRRAAEFENQELSEDQRYELRMFREIYKDDRVPPEFGKRFILAGKDAAGTNLWMVEFTHTVTAEEVEKVAIKLAAQYNMTIKPESIDAGSLVRSAIMKGDEADAERLSREGQVRRVQQDVKLKSGSNYKVGVGQKKEEPQKPGDEQEPKTSNVITSPEQGARYPVEWNLDRIDTRSRIYDQFY